MWEERLPSDARRTVQRLRMSLHYYMGVLVF
jgi:hypothetical protein